MDPIATVTLTVVKDPAVAVLDAWAHNDPSYPIWVLVGTLILGAATLYLQAKRALLLALIGTIGCAGLLILLIADSNALLETRAHGTPELRHAVAAYLDAEHDLAATQPLTVTDRTLEVTALDADGHPHTVTVTRTGNYEPLGEGVELPAAADLTITVD